MGEGASQPRRRTLAWIVVGLVLVIVMAVVVGVVRRVAETGAPERSQAGASLIEVAEAVGGWVDQRGELPRVAVEMTDGGDPWPAWTLWDAGAAASGAEVPHLVEGVDDLPLLGTVQRWCIETAYTIRRAFPALSPWDPYDLRWVSVVGERGGVSAAHDQQCPAELGLHLSEPVTAPSGTGAGSAVPVRSVPAGTCLGHLFNSPAAGDVWETGEAEVRDCAGPHFGEVYHAGELPEGPHDPAAVEEQVRQECATGFPPYVGVPYEMSQFSWDPFAPTASDWRDQDRSFTCVLRWFTDAYELYGTARDSLR